MDDPLPKRTRVYRNHMLDSTQWDGYVPRDDDVIVSTSYKSGTTWVLAILRELFALAEPMPPFEPIWVDRFGGGSNAEHARRIDSQRHRRYLKSHLPLDGIPFFPQVRYIVVGRDPRDVFMSFWNHWRTIIDPNRERINATPGRVGPPLPAAPDDIRVAWRDWISRGWFAWESEGYPWWGNLRHTRTWWDRRHLDNVLFVHYADLQCDLDREVRRIGRHVGIEVPDDALLALRTAVSIDTMRAEAAVEHPAWAERFYFRGTNGRWRGVLTGGDLELYETKATEVLTDDARAWLEGRTG